MTTYNPFTDDSEIVTVSGHHMHLGYIAHRLGLDAQTLAQLRAGTHVCVPREDLERIKEWTCQHGGAGRTLALLTAMLAAATSEPQP